MTVSRETGVHCPHDIEPAKFLDGQQFGYCNDCGMWLHMGYYQDGPSEPADEDETK